MPDGKIYVIILYLTVGYIAALNNLACGRLAETYHSETQK